MQPDIAAWFESPGGARVLQTAIVPALAILVAGVLAALIARSAMRATLRRADREQAATAVAGLVEAARAAGDAEGSRGDRRRAARLRTEADVRVRLLPLKGAARAADWAAARTDALQGSPDPAAEVAQLRDALIAWVASPGRARRLFATRPAASSRVPAQREQAEPQRRRSSAQVQPEPAAEAPQPSEQREPSAQPAPSGDAAEVPAWRRTRSAERLQQQHDAKASADAEQDEGRTAPVRLTHAHRAEAATISEAEQLERVETHQTARSARSGGASAVQQTPQPERTSAASTPEWLDDYDDEAQVTSNLDLKTPPPVSASAVRDRAPAGDIVPRP